MMAPSLWEAEPQTPVEELGKADGTGQGLIFVSIKRGVLMTSGVKPWQLKIESSAAGSSCKPKKKSQIHLLNAT